MERNPVSLPADLARLVQKVANAADLARDLADRIGGGQQSVTVGLGPGVDVPLLDEELYAAEVARLDRELVVATIRAEADGYVVERGWSSFGVYTWAEADPGWESVPYMGSVRALRPGDQVALGSTPADAVRFRLPRSTMVPPPPIASRSGSPLHDAPTLDLEPSLSRGVPSTISRGGRRPARRPASQPRQLPPSARDRYQRRFDLALRHWHYAMVTFGDDESAVIPVDDPEVAGLRAALSRNLTHPERGYDLFVRAPGPDLWVKVHGEAVQQLEAGDVVRLVGGGNRIGFHGYVVELAAPTIPVPRFTKKETPTVEDIAEVLDLPVERLPEVDLVSARYRVLAHRFRPDRHTGEPGDLSRFLELKVCFDAWKDRYST